MHLGDLIYYKTRHFYVYKTKAVMSLVENAFFWCLKIFEKLTFVTNETK